MAIEKNRIYEYKLLQDIDLFDNVILNPRAIINKGINENSFMKIVSKNTILHDLAFLNTLNIDSSNIKTSGVKTTIESLTVNISSPEGNENTIFIGKNTADLLITSKNKLYIKESGRKLAEEFTQEYFNSLNIENGSIIESSQVNSYEVNANDVYFDDTLTGRDIKIYWDETRKSLMFVKKI